MADISAKSSAAFARIESLGKPAIDFTTMSSEFDSLDDLLAKGRIGDGEYEMGTLKLKRKYGLAEGPKKPAGSKKGKGSNKKKYDKSKW